MVKSLTCEEFIKKSIEKHGDKYDYSKVKYINNNTKVIIICKKHGEFQQIPQKHYLEGNGCSKCSGKYQYTTNEWILKATETHRNHYNYSKVNYVNCKTPVVIICKEHGDFLQHPILHLKGSGCVKCFHIENAQSQRSNTEEFIKRALEKYGDIYDYSKVDYINSQEKIIIICKEHGEFLQSPNKHLQGNGCKLCGIKSQTLTRSSNTEEFIEKAKEKYGDIYDYSKVNYKNSQTKIIIICKEHGEFLQAPNTHLQGHGCGKCSHKKNSQNNRSNTEEFIKRATEIHGELFDYSKVDYTNSKEKVIIICKGHGEFLQTPSHHVGSKQSGCKLCANKNNGIKQRMTNDEFIEKANQKHNNKYDYSKTKYTTYNEKIIVICKEHGEFIQSPSDHLSGCGCSKCYKKYSKSSILYLNFMSKMYNIQIQQGENSIEFKIPNTNFRADGFCQEINTIYEFHGTIYHGDPRCCNSNDYNWFGKNYGELYQKTLEREQLIRDLGYNLVIMWEHDWNNINNSIKKIQRKFRSNH